MEVPYHRVLIAAPWNYHGLTMKAPWNPEALWKHHGSTAEALRKHHESPRESSVLPQKSHGSSMEASWQSPWRPHGCTLLGWAHLLP